MRRLALAAIVGAVLASLCGRAIAADIFINSGTTTVTSGSSINQPADSVYVAFDADTTAGLSVVSGSLSVLDLNLGFTSGADATFALSGGTVNLGGGLLVGAGASTTGSTTVSGGVFSVASTIEVGKGGAGQFTMSGGTVSSDALILGVNTLSTGTATITGGTWTVTNDVTVGYNGTGALSVASGEMIVGGNLFGTGGVSIGSTGTLRIGTGSSGGTAATNIQNNGHLYLNSSGSWAYVDSVTGGGSVSKQGSGRVTISGLNSYTGDTIIEGGVLEVANTLATPGRISATDEVIIGSGAALLVDGGFVVSNSGTIASGGAATITSGSWNVGGNLTVSGSLGVSGSGLLVVGDTLSTSGSSATVVVDPSGTVKIGTGGTTGTLSADIASAGTVWFNRSTASTYSGAIGGTGDVVKSGAGALTVTGTSDYAGFTYVNAGALVVEGELTQTAVFVNSGATIGGTGSIGGSVVVYEGGALAPGSPTGDTGSLTVSSLNLAISGTGSGAVSQFTVNGTGAGTGYDQVVGTDPLASTITYGGTLELDFNGTSYAEYSVFHLFSNFDPTSVSGNFDGITLSGSNDFTGLTFTFDGDRGLWLTGTNSGGQYLEFNPSSGSLVVVPEPSTLLMAAAAFGVAGFAWGKRKRDEHAVR